MVSVDGTASIGAPAATKPSSGSSRARWPAGAERSSTDRLRFQALTERLQLAVAQIARRGDRRVAGDREDGVPVGTVVEQPDAAAQHRGLRAGQIVGEAKARANHERRPRVPGLRDAVARLADAVQRVAGAGDWRADEHLRVVGARRRQNDLSRPWIHGVQRVARARRGAVAAAGHIQHHRLARVPLIGEEVRHLLELVVLRLLAREAHAVVERQAAVHLPVVLQVELGVVVDHAAFDEPLRLLVLREDAGRRIGEAEAGVERIRVVVAEVDPALEAQAAAGADVLRLEAVVVVEAALERMAPRDLRHADRDVLRAVDVQPAGITLA